MTDDKIVEAMREAYDKASVGCAEDWEDRAMRAALSVARPMIEARRSWTLGDTERAHCFLVKHGRSVEPSREPGADRWRDDLADDFAAARRAGAEEMRERAAEIVKRWQQSQNLKLHAGEMSAPEERTAKAVLGAIEQILRALPLEG